ncbi:MAG: threonylcarbamoyl-AMP synthase [Ignavibacteriae bacterium]|nr:threonylcarbamoyl-AMP synthase [Ignavibacteria bacterium]MBI3364436.1 threonylcarbamoyl-AMP synthase [Ignavibacteriota bacterium]
MITRITTSSRIAAAFIRNGSLAAFPTETVYGLGADAFNEKAVRKIFIAKGRPSDNPLIVHITSTSEIERLAKRIPATAEKFIATFFPGPLTIILPKRENVSPLITAGLFTVGIRMPGHTVTQKFLHECGTPVVAPSANRSGRPSPTTWQAVKHDLDGRIACILKDDQTEVGLESTVVDCTGSIPIILRAGAVTLEQLRKIIPATRVADHLRHGVRAAKSPGLKYRHYAPKARVAIVSSPEEIPPATASAYIGLAQPVSRHTLKLVRVCRNLSDYAHSLFLFFRQCDEAHVQRIYCQVVPDTGLGLALMDRIMRASQK